MATHMLLHLRHATLAICSVRWVRKDFCLLVAIFSSLMGVTLKASPWSQVIFVCLFDNKETNKFVQQIKMVQYIKRLIIGRALKDRKVFLLFCRKFQLKLWGKLQRLTCYPFVLKLFSKFILKPNQAVINMDNWYFL